MSEYNYILMRKDIPVTMVSFNETGKMTDYSKDMKNPELAPLDHRYNPQWLKTWWYERAIPIGQDGIKEVLKANDCKFQSEYLLKNLGISLSDYYWVKPIDSDLQWKDVSPFQNDFSKDNQYSPNGSIQGTIRKTWKIINGQRYMIKGNKSPLSSECINEVIASEIHKQQGYTNYTDYQLKENEDRSYKYDCISKVFTSEKYEAITAWAIFTMENKPNHISNYNHFLNMCKKLNIDIDKLQQDLSYQIQADYIMSGYDRHLNNISLLRDADTLQFKGIAPLYDSGASFFVNHLTDINNLNNVKINSFCNTEFKQLNLVTDRDIFDINKLPSISYIQEMYHKDDLLSDYAIDMIVKSYEHKMDMLYKFQKGTDLDKSLKEKYIERE